MTLADLLDRDLVIPRIRARRPADVIPELSGHLADHYPGVKRQDVVRVLREREQLGSTALGDGIAIPHAKLDSIDRTMACLGRSRRGIDFGAPDGKPTHFFFVLVAPPLSTGEHLKTLARISRLFREGGFRERLLAAETGAEMYRIVAAEDAEP
jgi:PTS system nitrogen regulatory IIA component